MKRKTLSILLIGLMVLNLSACGENTSSAVSDTAVTQIEAVAEQPSEKETDEAAEEPKPEAEPEETKPEEVISENISEETDEAVTEEKHSEDTEAEPEESTTVEINPTNEVKDTSDTTSSSGSTDTVDIQQDVTAPDPHPTPDQQPAQPEPVADTGTSVATVTVSGTFDINDFVYNISNADDFWIIDHQVDLLYGSWFIEISTNTYSADSAYISIGRWDWNATYCNINTYSYVFPFGNGSKVVSEDYPGYGNSVSQTALSILPTLVEYMKNSGAPSVAPNIPGCTFKPCQSNNPFVQY